MALSPSPVLMVKTAVEAWREDSCAGKADVTARRVLKTVIECFIFGVLKNAESNELLEAVRSDDMKIVEMKVVWMFGLIK